MEILPQSFNTTLPQSNGKVEAIVKSMKYDNPNIMEWEIS